MRWTLALIVVTWAGVVHADDGGTSWVDYRAVDGCPDAATFVADVTRHVGGAPEGETLRVRLRLDAGGGWVANVWRGDASRQIRAPSCTEVAEAAALIGAMLVGEVLPEVESPPAPVFILGTAPTPVSTPTLAPVPAPAPALVMDVSFGVATEVGALPDRVLGGRVAIGLVRGNWRLEVAGTRWQSAAVREDQAVLASVELWDVGVAACRSWAYGVATCAGADVGRLAGVGMDVVAARADSDWWIAVTTGVSLSSRMYGPVIAEVRGELQLPVRAPSFVLASGEVLHAPSRMAGRLGLGLRVEFN